MKLLENKNMSLVLKSILVVSILVFIVNYHFKSNKFVKILAIKKMSLIQLYITLN